MYMQIYYLPANEILHHKKSDLHHHKLHLYIFCLYIYNYILYIQVHNMYMYKKWKTKNIKNTALFNIFHPLYNCYHLPLLENDSHPHHKHTMVQSTGYYYIGYQICIWKIHFTSQQAIISKKDPLVTFTQGDTILYCNFNFLYTEQYISKQCTSQQAFIVKTESSLWKKDKGQRTKDKLQITEAPQYNKCWNLEFLQDNIKALAGGCLEIFRPNPVQFFQKTIIKRH